MLDSFVDELSKIAGVKSTAILGALGGAYGGYQGSKGMVDAQTLDDIRLRRGVISVQDWKKRRAMRRGKAVTSAVGGATLASLIPTGAKKTREWVVGTAREAAVPLRKSLEDAGETTISKVRNEADRLHQTLKKDPVPVVQTHKHDLNFWPFNKKKK